MASSPLFARRRLHWTNTRPSVFPESSPPDYCPRQHLLLCTWQTVLQQMRKRINPKGCLCRQLVMTYSSILKLSCTKKTTIFSGFQLQNTAPKVMSELWGVLSGYCMGYYVHEASVLYLHLPVGALVIYTGCDSDGKLSQVNCLDLLIFLLISHWTSTIRVERICVLDYSLIKY